MRRLEIAAAIENSSLEVNEDGEITLNVQVTDAIAKWLESAIINVTPSDFDRFNRFDGDEHGINADGICIIVHPEGK